MEIKPEGLLGSQGPIAHLWCRGGQIHNGAMGPGPLGETVEILPELGELVKPRGSCASLRPPGGTHRPQDYPRGQ